MKIALFHDGSYKKYKNGDDITSLLPDIRYLVIDNSTVLKGKTYTIVDAQKLRIDNYDDPTLLGFKMNISFAADDIPWCEETSIKSTIPINSLEKTYSIYPLIKQLFEFNYFKDVYLQLDDNIAIESIVIKTKEQEITLNSDNIEKAIRRNFKALKMTTCVYKVLGDNYHLILKKGRWYISDVIPSNFEYVGYNLSNIETIYLLKEDQLNRLETIDYIDIDMYDRWYEESLVSVYNTSADNIFNTHDGEGTNRFSCHGLTNLLQACVFFPQLIELEKMLYTKRTSLKITLVTKRLNYVLDITEEETTTQGLCLFKIINKLLQM